MTAPRLDARLGVKGLINEMSFYCLAINPITLVVMFSHENAYFLMRFRPTSTLKRPKTMMKTAAFETVFESAVLCSRF